jgi:hypothetical protein
MAPCCKIISSRKNQGGFLALDFIFSLTISIGFAVAFFALATTFSTVELAQYIIYSTSRAYAGAHATQEAQKTLAEAKFDELMKVKAFKSLFRSGWFKLAKPEISNFNSLYPVRTQDDAGVFWGVRSAFEASVLDIKIPFIGNTKTKPTTGKATISSFLMREPTTQECLGFNRARFDAIKALDGSYGSAGAGTLAIISDNGC